MFPTRVSVELLQTALGNDLLLFLPELAVCVGIVGLLLARLVPALDKLHLGGATVAVLVAALFAAGYQVSEGQWAGMYFAGMLTSDAWAGVVRVIVLAAALVTALLTLFT